MRQRNRGFTLLELMIVVAIIAILVTVAYPSYQEFVFQGKRTDAKTGLINIQLAQEKYRANNPNYGTLAQIGESSASPDGFYTLSVSVVGATPQTYSATATPVGAQANDSKCGSFSTTQDDNETASGSESDAYCWQ